MVGVEGSAAGGPRRGRDLSTDVGRGDPAGGNLARELEGALREAAREGLVARFRVRVREGFLKLAKIYPAPIVVIDGSDDADAVAARLQSEVARALALGPRS